MFNIEKKDVKVLLLPKLSVLASVLVCALGASFTVLPTFKASEYKYFSKKNR